MSAALIPAQYVPIARTDADWAMDIDFQEEVWTGSAIKVAFARQGLPVEVFEIDAAPGADPACPIRIPAATWATKAPGIYSVEIRKIDGGAIDDAAVFEVQLHRGLTDAEGPVRAPAGDGARVGSAIVNRAGTVTVVRGGAGPVGPPGPNQADLIAFDDTLTAIGADTVQDALAFILGLQGYGPGTLNFSNPSNAVFIGAI